MAISRPSISWQGTQDLCGFQDNFLNINCKRSCGKMGPSVVHSFSSQIWDLCSTSEREKGMMSQANYPLENHILEERKMQCSSWWFILSRSVRKYYLTPMIRFSHRSQRVTVNGRDSLKIYNNVKKVKRKKIVRSSRSHIQHILQKCKEEIR